MTIISQSTDLSLGVWFCENQILRGKQEKERTWETKQNKKYLNQKNFLLSRRVYASFVGPNWKTSVYRKQ
jgi:hypothetical protein